MRLVRWLARCAGVAVILGALTGCAYEQASYPGWGASYTSNYPYAGGLYDAYFGPGVLVSGFGHDRFHQLHSFHGPLHHFGQFGHFDHGFYSGFAHGGFGGLGRG